MRKSLHVLAALMAVCLGLQACMGDNDEIKVSSSETCYIGSFTLGTMKRTLHTTSSTGTDSTYQLTFSGSLYALRIDQRAQTITNPEPLPEGTQLGAVLATISGMGTIVYTPEADTTQWTAYAANDSINFSQPLLFRVYGADLSYRQYRLTLSVRQNSPTDYSWEHLAGNALAGRSERRALAWKDGVLVVGTDAAGLLHATTFDADGQAVADQLCVGAEGAELQTLCAAFGHLWMSTADGVLLSSGDGVNWTSLSPSRTGDRIALLAASPGALYARITNEQLSTAFELASSTDGSSWTALQLDDDSALFPIHSVSIAYTQTNGNPRVLVAGPTAAGTSQTTVWSLLEGKGEPWVLFARPGDNDYPLPWLQDLCVVEYNHQLVAMGGTGIGSDDYTALAQCYISRDNGITWKADDDLKVPSTDAEGNATNLIGTTEHIAAASQGEYIWLFAGDQIWRARLNSYGE